MDVRQSTRPAYNGVAKYATTSVAASIQPAAACFAVPRDVMFEAHSVNNFYREGWRPAMLKVGDRIKVRFNPRKDGADGGFVNGFVTAEGKEIAFRAPGQPLPVVPPDAATAPAKGTAREATARPNS